MAFKIKHTEVGFLPPFVGLPTTANEAYTVGEALKLSSGALTKVDATDKPEYICGENYTAPSAGQRAIMVQQVRPDITYETTCGLRYGLAVTEQETPKMTVKVSSGVIYMENGAKFKLDAVPSVEVTTADSSNPRKDIIYVSAEGEVAYLAGTAAASPTAPEVPTGGVVLAEILVAQSATTIGTAAITAKVLDSSAVIVGDVVTIHADGSRLTATEASGVATVLAKEDNPLRGTVVLCRFK